MYPLLTSVRFKDINHIKSSTKNSFFLDFYKKYMVLLVLVVFIFIWKIYEIEANNIVSLILIFLWEKVREVVTIVFSLQYISVWKALAGTPLHGIFSSSITCLGMVESLFSSSVSLMDVLIKLNNVLRWCITKAI